MLKNKDMNLSKAYPNLFVVELGASSGRWSIRMTGRRIGWVAICSNQRVIYIRRTYNPKIPFQGPCSPTKRYLNRTRLRTPRAAWLNSRVVELSIVSYRNLHGLLHIALGKISGITSTFEFNWNSDVLLF